MRCNRIRDGREPDVGPLGHWQNPMNALVAFSGCVVRILAAALARLRPVDPGPSQIPVGPAPGSLDSSLARFLDPGCALVGQQVVLVVVAHCDDEVIGPGASLALLSRATGFQVFVMVLAADRFERRVESLRAGAVLGIPPERFFFGALPDGDLDGRRDEIRSVLRIAIRELRPTLVLTHRADAHPDHCAIQAAVLEVAGHASGVSILHFRVPQHRIVAFGPNAFIRVPAAAVEDKLRAFKRFGSQAGKSYFFEHQALGSLEEGGVSAGCRWAETFEIGRLRLAPSACGCLAVAPSERPRSPVLEAAPDDPRVVLGLCPRCQKLALAS